MSPYPDAGGRCPWFAIAKCPLYIESHNGRGLGCVDDMALPCRVRRGVWNYHHAVYRLIAAGVNLDPEQLANLPTGGSA